MPDISKTKGFALLYAILLTGAVLMVGLILMNIITKQLVFSSLNRNSEISYYYVANSGRECLRRFIDLDRFANFDPLAPLGNRYSSSGNQTIDCFEVPFELIESNIGDGFYKYQGGALVAIGGGNQYLDLLVEVNLNKLNNNPVPPTYRTIDNYGYLAITDGYNQDPTSGGNRITKRSAVYVQ